MKTHQSRMISVCRGIDLVLSEDPEKVRMFSKRCSSYVVRNSYDFLSYRTKKENLESCNIKKGTYDFKL